ncbi:MAG: hypothetical protein QOE70_395 [Chthoniobacter sp.]|nr:hypothetical protein [Chthoniobacter sp.]
MTPSLKSFVRVVAVLGVGTLLSTAAEPFLRPHDVIAIVGGEDMVVMSEYGYLELLLTRALPEYQLRFRNLAWEGDTVFEQRRDLNFPTLEEQLDKVGATVVLTQFGQMESFAGKEKLPEFIAAYEKLISRLNGGGKRRVMVHPPASFELLSLPPVHHLAEAAAARDAFDVYVEAITRLREYEGDCHVVFRSRKLTRDSIHASDLGSWLEAKRLGFQLANEQSQNGVVSRSERPIIPPELLVLIRTKNRLWFDYWRVQNWAFLAGDRTTQPSSRDHLDPSKRWFPPEREAFLPLIEAKEKEIDALARKLGKP